MAASFGSVPSGGSVAGAPGELGRVLAGWNDTAREVPEATLAELFGAQAARSPDAVAVSCGDVVLSYAELDVRAGRLAGYLASAGAGPGRLVAVVMEKSAEVFVAWLGVAMSGAAFLPVDLAYPAERIGFMLADAGPDLVVTTAAAAASVPVAAGGGPVLVVLDDPVVAGVLAGRGPWWCRRAAPAGTRGSGVRDLYVGVDGQAEGDGGDAPGAGEPGRVDGGRVRDRAGVAGAAAQLAGFRRGGDGGADGVAGGGGAGGSWAGAACGGRAGGCADGVAGQSCAGRPDGAG